MVLDDKNPWDGKLASIMFALSATNNTTRQYPPTQLIFGRDSIINQRHEVHWKTIRKQKQDLINKRNERENLNRINNTYKEGDKVLLKNAWKTKFNRDTYKGPYEITAVRNNGTVRANKGRVTDTFKHPKSNSLQEISYSAS